MAEGAANPRRRNPVECLFGIRRFVLKLAPDWHSRALAALFGFGLVANGCGEPLSTSERACPCESGWTCCASRDVCVGPGEACPTTVDSTVTQCPSGMALSDVGLMTASPDGGAAALATSTQVRGDVLGTLVSDGREIPFDYAHSASIDDGAMTLRGWIVVGGGAQKFRVGVWAEDGTTRLGLSLAAYGPIELGPEGNDCFAALVGGGPIASDDGIFAPPTWGRYFVTAYHAVAVAEDGALSIQAEGDTRYTSAYIRLEKP